MEFPSILFEDDNFLAIDRPSGLNVHQDGKTRETTLADLILKKYPELEKVGEPQELNGVTVLRPGIVHRLDKDTSGVLLIAKNQKAFEHLKGQFKNHEVNKTYMALVWGAPKDDEGIIEAPISRHRGDIRKWTAFPKGKRGREREATTYWRVVKRFKIGEDKASLLEVRPKTGRTHQIRVHLQSIGCPIVCDPLYSSKRACPPSIGRLSLHAYSIEFKGMDGNIFSFKSQLPEIFNIAK